MIKFFRDEKKYFVWVLWIVVAVFVAYVFVDFGRSSSGTAGGDVAATVGGERITRKEFFDEYRARERQYSQMFKGNMTAEMRRSLNLPRQVLSDMVDRVLLRKEAAALGLRVDDTEVMARIARDPNLQQNGEFIGLQRYEAVLRASGLTTARYEQMVRDGILLEKLNRLLERTVALPDNLLEEEFRRRNDRATLEYVFLPSAAEEGSVAVSDADLKAYYDKNGNDFRLAERRQVKYLLVDLAKLREQSVVGDDEARAAYAQNSAEYSVGEQVRARHILVKTDGGLDLEAARAKAERLLAQVKSGADFAKLARENSDDPGSKTSGGDLGFFARGQMVQEFDAAAFAAADGEVVPTLVRTQFGFHIIQTLEHRAASQRPFEEVAAQIKAKLAAARADTAAEARAKELATRAASASTDDALRNMAESTGVVTFNTTEYFGREDEVPGIGRSAEFVTAVFALPKGGVTKEPIQTSRGWIVAKVSDVREAGIAPFDEVKARVEAAARREKAQQSLLARFQAALAAVPENQSMAAAAKALGAEAKTTGELGRGGQIDGIPGGGKQLLAEVFRKGEVDRRVGPMALPTGGVAVARVVSRVAFDPAAFAAQKDQLRDTVRQEESQRLLQSILGASRSKSKIEMNEELIEQLLRG